MIESKMMIDNDVITKSEQSNIDSRAVIDASAKIGKGVKIGPWSVVGPNVEVGDRTQIASHVVINRDTKLGCDNKIYSFAAIGGDPQDLEYHDEPTFLEIGDNNIIREHVTISRGSIHGAGTTKIGNNNNILACSHIAHDCLIGNYVLFVNHATIAGHVIVDDHAIIGALGAVHQFCRIGAHSFLCHAAMVTQDVPPFIIVSGEEAQPKGLNVVGLRRAGFSKTTIMALKRAYHIIYLKGLKNGEIKKELSAMVDETPEVALMLEIIENSKRGIVR